jgi:hypothetical protein
MTRPDALIKVGRRCYGRYGWAQRAKFPKRVATAIKKCWPVGLVEEFDTDESYFHQIHPRLERDLRNIYGAALLWQTEEQESSASWNDDQEDEPPPSEDWQSYHLFWSYR